MLKKREKHDNSIINMSQIFSDDSSFIINALEEPRGFFLQGNFITVKSVTNTFNLLSPAVGGWGHTVPSYGGWVGLRGKRGLHRAEIDWMEFHAKAVWAQTMLNLLSVFSITLVNIKSPSGLLTTTSSTMTGQSAQTSWVSNCDRKKTYYFLAKPIKPQWRGKKRQTLDPQSSSIRPGSVSLTNHAEEPKRRLPPPTPLPPR